MKVVAEWASVWPSCHNWFARCRGESLLFASQQLSQTLQRFGFFVQNRMEHLLIHKPKVRSEFEMQAELYFHLKKEGFDVRGEVPAKSLWQRSSFDLVVFFGDYGAVIIEVKNTPHWNLVQGKRTAQRVKYERFELPVIYYTTVTPLDSVLSQVRNAMHAIGAMN